MTMFPLMCFCAQIQSDRASSSLEKQQCRHRQTERCNEWQFSKWQWKHLWPQKHYTKKQMLFYRDVMCGLPGNLTVMKSLQEVTQPRHSPGITHVYLSLLSVVLSNQTWESNLKSTMPVDFNITPTFTYLSQQILHVIKEATVPFYEWNYAPYTKQQPPWPKVAITGCWHTDVPVVIMSHCLCVMLWRM